MTPERANTGRRLGAALIDYAPIYLIVFLIQNRGSASPVDSARSTAPYLVAVYVLLRDVTGASLGKSVLGLRVTRFPGTEAALGRRILRNATLAIATLGPAIGGVIGDMMQAFFFLELVSVVVSKERIGDKIADTVVLHAGQASEMKNPAVR